MRGQAACRLLQFNAEVVDPTPEIAIEHERRNGDDEPECRVVQRHRDAMRQQCRVGVAAGLRAKNLDQADHGAEQPQQWRGGSHGAERVEVALQSVHDGAPTVFQIFTQAFHCGVRSAHGTKARREHSSKRRIALQFVDGVGRGDPDCRDRHGFFQQARWNDFGATQRSQAFKNDGQGRDGAGDQRPDGPASGFDDAEQDENLGVKGESEQWADNEQHGKRWNRTVDHVKPRLLQAQSGGFERSRTPVLIQKANSRDPRWVIPKNCG